MKLSEMVRLRNELETFSLVPITTSTNDVDSHLTRISNLPAHGTYKDKLSYLITQIDSIEDKLESIDSARLELIQQLDQEITKVSSEFLARGYMINGDYGAHSTSIEVERNARSLEIMPETLSEAIVQVRKYTDWRYPGLEIGPGDGAWTEHLIASDPLYIVDIHQEFLDSTLSRFNETYRKRVRSYLTGPAANKSDSDLSMLPQRQFGFIFSWNVFDYFPLKETQDMLIQCFNLLRPGGHMLFTFNNCDTYQCAEYAEQGFKSWMPARLLATTCKEIGFEIVHFRNPETTINWIEIRKPGDLKTVKGHQVLGEIISQ
jgi:phospholipid N-methyltransferase